MADEDAGHDEPAPGAAREPQRLHRVLHLSLQAVLVGGIVLALVQAQWLAAVASAGTLGIMLLPSVLARRLRLIVPPELEVLAVAFIFAALFLGEVRGYYAKFWWWDLALHTCSGFLLGVFGFILVWVLNEDEHVGMDLRPGFISLFAFCFAMAAGGVWEIFEFTVDQTFGLNMQKSGLVDTMWDLIVDAVGAATIAILGYGWLQKPEQSFLERWIDQSVKSNPRLFRR